jgi:hypothetical protein
MRGWRYLIAVVLLAALSLAGTLVRADIAVTDKISDVRGTKHNFSNVADSTGTPSGGKVPVRAVKADDTNQICAFCHTPHQAESITFSSGDITYGAPLWNRRLSEQTYTPYTSSSMDARAAELTASPGGSSKLCLSCHDGSMAINKVNVLNGASAQIVPLKMSGGTAEVKMPGNSKTGFTRNLGTDLSADHPISFTYDSTVAGYDGELHSPNGVVVGNRNGAATKPMLPLENSQMQCATCHDPHLRDKTTSNGNAKFLRLNRFQVGTPKGGAFDSANDIICLACHEKAGKSWAYSAHANSQVAKQTYKPAAAQQREFPSSLDTPVNTEPPVWQVGCLNCHDTHTVQGARKLLREGSSDSASPKIGGNSAIEQTCYQCHTTSTDSIVNYTKNAANDVPDIKGDFGLLRRMPIDKAAGEVHDIGGVFDDSTAANCSKTAGKCGKDLLESRANLGFGGTAQDLGRRHAECSDCHNPHRVVKFKDFRGNTTLGDLSTAPDASGTHNHTDTASTHTNIASGVLRGSWGVEPGYPDAKFSSIPDSFAVKRGDPGGGATANVTDSYVTREYQICLKCHSNYGYSDNNKPDAAGGTGNRPVPGATGTTPLSTNGVSMYTNQAKEFQAPSTHKGPINSNTCLDKGTDAGANLNTCNHRSWHPVMAETGRNLNTRGITSTNPWRTPWSNQVGSNTMYCSDCHGSGTGAATAIPNNGDNGSPWGPHGSDNDFLLKGAWTDATSSTSNLLCFKCHLSTVYSGTGDSGNRSGFYNSSKGNLHNYHDNKISNPMRCTWCHVAVPHGWKNKALLVNLNDVGPEAGLAVGTSIADLTIVGSESGPAIGYSNGPYYVKAMLKVKTFKASGQWTIGDCGGSNSDNWMRAGTRVSRGEGICKNPP